MKRPINLPNRLDNFEKLRGQFEKWLLANGSAIFAPTNPYEVSRFQTMEGIGIIYSNNDGKLTAWVNKADEAMLSFLNSRPWRGTKPTKRKGKSIIDFRALSKRDGFGCMYCGTLLSENHFTIEHVVPVTAGGPNHLSNKALACYACNHEAGHLSARQKFELALTKRTRRSQTDERPAA